MTRTIRTLTLALAVAAVAAPAASAKTLVVDDDNGCADKQYSTIQSAVDAASPGDTVKVCDGTYMEAVEIHVDKIKLISRTPHGATLLAHPAAPAPIFVYNESVLVRGFRFDGNPPRGACTDAIEVTGSATIDNNVITDFHCADPTSHGGAGVVIDSFEDTTTTVSNNVIINPGAVGISVFSSSEGLARVQNNRLVMTPTMATGPAGIRCLDCHNAKIQANSIEGSPGPGIRADESDVIDKVLISGNVIRNNAVGISTGDRHGPGLKVQKNRVLDNVGNGIEHDGTPAYFKNNRSLGNGGFDCFDAAGSSSSATWTGNVGLTDSPFNLCRPPD